MLKLTVVMKTRFYFRKPEAFPATGTAVIAVLPKGRHHSHSWKKFFKYFNLEPAGASAETRSSRWLIFFLYLYLNSRDLKYVNTGVCDCLNVS